MILRCELAWVLEASQDCPGLPLLRTLHICAFLERLRSMAVHLHYTALPCGLLCLLYWGSL